MLFIVYWGLCVFLSLPRADFGLSFILTHFLYTFIFPLHHPILYKKNSLHALLTNIKWDFNNTNQLAGEVSIPNKAIHQRFCLDKNELSEFDISNKLWKMIEG